MIRLAIILSLVALSACTSSPTECARSSDCFAYETCSFGKCVTIVADDAGATDDVGATDAASTDGAMPPDAGTVDTSMSDASPDDPDASADLGLDCAEPCGETEICASGSCEPAPALTQWRLDGELVARTLDAEAMFFEAQDTAYIAMPHFGRNVTVSVTDVTTTPTLHASCDDMSSGQRPLSVITSDNGWSHLDELPMRWKGVILNASHCADGTIDGDQLVQWETNLTVLTRYNVEGTVVVEIRGGGIRAGETLLIESTFDLSLDQM